MINAIKEISKHTNLYNNIVNDFVKSDQTKIINNVLFYRSIPEGLMYLSHFKNGHDLKFSTNFENFGTMIDLSRGAVFNISYIKYLIRTKALMGANEMWLYMEDVYELIDYPVFGYLRGKYTKDELLEIVEYSKIFGVKLIPAIQTLGHMEQFLRWNKARPYKDQSEILIANNENTYKLIDSMFKLMKEVFETDKIHIGLDETFGLGFGSYFKQYGFKNPRDIFLDHLVLVEKIAKEHGFSDILVWSDMFYRTQSKTNSYYDLEMNFNEEVLNKIPKSITLVYWDYYNEKYEIVDKMIKNHKQLNRKITFASGTWIWTRFTYDKVKTDKTALVHLEAANNNGIKDFILTQWGDDGAYGDHLTTLLGVYELSVKANTENDFCKKTFNDITSLDYDILLNKTKLNETTMNQVGLLWDDPQYAMYLNNFTYNNLDNFDKHIKELETLIKLYEKDIAYENELNIVLSNYYKILGRKAMIESYIKNEEINASIYFEKQIHYLNKLNNTFRNRWYKLNKMYGLDVIQSRFGTQIIRAEEMINLEKEYNNKNITKIDGLLDKTAVYDEGLSLKFINLAYTTRPF